MQSIGETFKEVKFGSLLSMKKARGNPNLLCLEVQRCIQNVLFQNWDSRRLEEKAEGEKGPPLTEISFRQTQDARCPDWEKSVVRG